MAAPNDDGGGGAKSGTSSGGGSVVCRQTSTRWTPTAEQIRILKDLYYNSGVRSPTAEQIQRISAKLRHYGKIEGKNVFYWFQNHKARERQKKRFTSVPPPPPPSHPFSDHHHLNPAAATKFNTPISPSAGFGGPLAMEMKFREFCVTPGNSGVCTPQSFVWDPFSGAYHVKFPMRMEKDEEPATREIETLPLFPIHDEMAMKLSSHGDEFGVASDGASLELSLNSSYHGIGNGHETYFP